MLRRYFADLAWLSTQEGVRQSVEIEVTDGVIGAVTAGVSPHPSALRLPGFLMPGLVNSHSHAFHRALRGRTHCGRGDFWTWRDQMYAVAERLTPDTYRDLACATYAEMVCAGITTVVEFHYLHHDVGGARYNDSAEMARALADAAATAGIRLVLLDTLYLQADVDGKPLSGPQLRFGDRDADQWRERLAAVAVALPSVKLGGAIHSVRGCPPDAMRTAAAWAGTHDAPLHIHLSEQIRENTACVAAHGRTPAQLCDDTGVLGPTTTAVHATHLTDADIRLLGSSATIAGFCPTTERDLADGIGPARELRDAGSLLALGSDSHAVIDLFEEARAVELNERLRTMRRGGHTSDDLLAAATSGGAASAGLGERTGTIAPGMRADFIAVDTDSVRLAGGPDPVAATVFAATASDVTHVISDGVLVVADRRHLNLPSVGGALSASINRVLAN